MEVRFDPTQLSAARQARELVRLVKELFPPDARGNVAVTQRFRDDPMLLVFSPQGREPVAIPFQREMLYSPGCEEQLRSFVIQLRDRTKSARVAL